MKQLGFTGCFITLLALTSMASAQTGQSPNAVNSDLRDLLQAASEDGWIEFVPDEKTIRTSPAAISNSRVVKARDCSILDGVDPNGLFDENPINNGELNGLLPKLLEGEHVTQDQLDLFSGLSTCGPMLAMWEHLALSQVKGKTVPADEAIAALYFQSAYIRERAGVTLAIAAGLANDSASLRRFADMLQDARLHDTEATERDPRHILLDALLLESSDPTGARERYEWLTENGGPEQILALDRLTILGGNKFASESLDRLAQDLSLANPSHLVDRKMRAALESGELSDVSSILNSRLINPTDLKSETLTLLVDHTRTALSGDNLIEKITALDLYSGFPNLYVDQDLEADATLAFETIIGVGSDESNIVEKDRASVLVNASSLALETTNSGTVSQFILDMSDDLMTAERILSNG